MRRRDADAVTYARLRSAGQHTDDDITTYQNLTVMDTGEAYTEPAVADTYVNSNTMSKAVEVQHKSRSHP